MPNYCTYGLKAKGRKENLEKFFEILNNDYDYGKKNPLHMYRIFEANGDVNETEMTVDGYCAWSVNSCMLGGTLTYYDDNKSHEPNATTLDQIAKALNLSIEVYSEEPGMCFAEHYAFDSEEGEVFEETTEYNAVYIEELESYEDLKEDWKGIENKISKEEFYRAKKEGKDYITTGGFEYSYDFINSQPDEVIKFI